jgi:hypothetical protein
MSVPSWVQVAEASALAVSVRESTYLFPAIEVVHLLGLTLLLAAVVVSNLSALGVFAKSCGLAVASRRVFWSALALTLFSGAVLFATEAAKCFYSDAFRLKVFLLALAIAVQITSYRFDGALVNSRGLARPVAVVALLLWFGVGAAGRFIGFS